MGRLENFKRYMDKLVDGKEDTVNVLYTLRIGASRTEKEALDVAIDAVEQEPKRQEWIPVIERLPEDDGLYLVYTEEQPFVCPFEDNGFFIDDVLAWMPLPGPYKAESEVRDEVQRL